MSDELKSCPFCGRSGNEIKISQDAPQYPVFVECPCACTLCTDAYTMRRAVETWNRRVNP